MHLPPDKLYITVAGIKRSGTTWMANAIRIICEEAGLKVWMGEHRPDMEQLHPNFKIAEAGFPRSDVVINKIHPFIYEVARASDLVFSSYRNLLDVAQSWERFKGPNAPEQYQQWCVWYYQWRPYVKWEMDYKLLADGPKAHIIETLIGILTPYITAALNKRWVVNHYTLLERLKTEVVPPTDKDYDPTTLLFKNHITSDL